MNNYERLKEQVEFETKCCIDSINRMNPDYDAIPYDITLTDFIGDYGYIDMYDRGTLFAYLSIKSAIEKIEKQ